MTAITSTESGAVGRYINLGSPASQDDTGAQTWCFYCKPTGVPASTAGYLFGKTPSASISGPRLAVVGATNTYLQFGLHSDTAGNPNRTTSPGSVTLGNWQHIFATTGGWASAAGLHIYVDSAECTYAATNEGTGLVASDASNDLFLMNRGNSGALGRDFIGDFGYAARWNRVLTETERSTVIADGPLAVPDGLILCWANDQDYSSNGVTAVARSTRVTGSTPPNTALGGSSDGIASGGTGTGTGSGTGGGASGSADGSAAGGTGTGIGSGTGGGASGSADGSAAGGTGTGSGTGGDAAVLELSGAYERSSVNLSGSSIVGTGDSAIISILPKTQEGEASTPNIAWADPSCDVTGVSGLRPTFRFLAYKGTSGGLHGFSDGAWPSTRRPMFSYDDGLTWTYFDTCTPNSGSQYVGFRHNTAFTQNKIRVSKSRQTTVHQVGDWLQALANAHAFVVPTTTAAGYTPSGDMAGFSAPAFIADEFSPQVDSLGVTIPAMPFYAAEINDTSMMPVSGNPKRFLMLSNGVHSGENISVPAFRALVTFLCGNSVAALNIRRNYRVLFYPCMNAPGIAGGGVRGSWTQGVGGVDDPSRHFNEAGTGLEVIDIPRDVMDADHDNYATVDAYLDLHGMYNDYNGFHQTIYIDDNNGLTERFRVLTASLGAESLPVLPVVMPPGGVSRYFREQGVRMSVSLEQGDGAPVSDAALTNHGEALAKAFGAMINEGAFFATASGGTGTGIGSGSGGDAVASGGDAGIATGGTGTGTGSGSGGSATGQIAGIAAGGTGTGTGSGSGGNAEGAAGGAGVATGGSGTGTGSGSGGTATGQVAGNAGGGTGSGVGSGAGGDASGQIAGAASGGTGSGTGTGTGGDATGETSGSATATGGTGTGTGSGSGGEPNAIADAVAGGGIGIGAGSGTGGNAGGSTPAMFDSILPIYELLGEVVRHIPVAGNEVAGLAVFDRPGRVISGGEIIAIECSIRYPTETFPIVKRGDAFAIGSERYLVREEPMAVIDGLEKTALLARAA